MSIAIKVRGINQQNARLKVPAVARYDAKVHQGNIVLSFRRGRNYRVLERDQYYTKLAAGPNRDITKIPLGT